MMLRCWKSGCPTGNAFKPHFLLLISHNSVLQLIATTSSPPFTAACNRKKVTENNIIRLPSLPAIRNSRLFSSVIYGFCLCNIYDEWLVTHRKRTLSPQEGNTGKLCCSNFRNIKTMFGNGTVPSWHKHGTVQPSQLNHTLLFPTTYWINVKQTSESGG